MAGVRQIPGHKEIVVQLLIRALTVNDFQGTSDWTKCPMRTRPIPYTVLPTRLG